MPLLKNIRHELYAQHLARGLNSNDACAKAGFARHSGSASRLKKYPDIQLRVEELLDAGAVRAEITIEKVLRELARIAFADVRSLHGEDGRLLPIAALSADAAAVVASYEVVRRIVTARKSKAEGSDGTRGMAAVGTTGKARSEGRGSVTGARTDGTEEPGQGGNQNGANGTGKVGAKSTEKLKAKGSDKDNEGDATVAESVEEFTTKIKVWDKERALSMIGRYLVMFPEKQRSGTGDGPSEVEVEDVRRRLFDEVTGVAARLRAKEDHPKPE